jgi:hypothetical protein
MDASSDVEVLAAVGRVIAGRAASEVLQDLYHGPLQATEEALNMLASLLPIEQIAAVGLVGRLHLSDLSSAVLLLAVLRNIRSSDGWIHFNLSKSLGTMIEAGVQEAKLPAIIHSLMALNGLKDSPSAGPLPLGVLSRELVTIAPREAVRSGMLAARSGSLGALRSAGPAVRALGLDSLSGHPPITRAVHIAKALHFDDDTIPQTTSLKNAAGARSTPVEPLQRTVFPPIRGDGSHYIFAQACREEKRPGITVHTLEDAIFSIDVTSPGLEQHYLFDRDKNCVLEFANGVNPFIADTVLEFDEPVAILTDLFSGAMNICHFLLDNITRIPIYDRATSGACKFLLADGFPYYRHIIARFGLTDRVIIPSPKRVSIKAREILFSSNIAADFRHPAHHCAGWAIDYLRRQFKIAERPARAGRKIMISRADTRGRGIVNWPDVEQVFRRDGFEVVTLAGRAVDEQIALFQDAAQVVGVHGAGLTNILFAPRDCCVLEIVPPLVAVHDYWLLASSLGQRYSALVSEDLEFPRPDYTRWSHDASLNGRDTFVPLDRLKAALAAM